MATPSNNTPPRPPPNPNPLTPPPTLLPTQSQPLPQQQQQLQQTLPPSSFQGLFRSPLHPQAPGSHLQHPPRGHPPFHVQPTSSTPPNPKRLPQKPPPRPPPPSSSSSPSPSSFKSSELTPASARRKKPKLPDKRLPDRVAALLPESALYTQLLEFESRVDAALARKKTDIQEALKSPPSTQRTLRIYIFNTTSNQTPSSEPPSWTLRIIGRILEDTIPENIDHGHQQQPSEPNPMFPKFSFFLKRLTISLDPALYPENPTIVWENSRSAVPQEGFEVRRIGDKEFTVGIRLEMNYNPEKFKLSPPLVELLGIEVESRARIIAAIWHYVKARKLQNPSDPSFFACDPALKNVFGEDRMKFALVSQKISQHLSPPPPIHLEHRVRLSGGSAAAPLGTACYDVLVDVPFSLQKEMSSFLSNTEKYKEIEACDEVILASIKKIHEHRRRRAFFLGFSQSPVEFINALIASQTRDLKVVAGEAGGNAEKERRSDFYNQPWVEDAVIRYLNRKPAPGTDASGGGGT